jgi:hypothetical protein
VFRLKLAGLANRNLNGVEWSDPTLTGTALYGHLVQGSRSGAIWAAPLSTSTMRVWRWSDNSWPVSTDITTNSWCNADYHSGEPIDTTSTAQNWLGDEGSGVSGAESPDQSDLVLAWGAGDRYNINGQAGACGFPYPHIEMLQLSLAGGQLGTSYKIQQQIWNNSFAFGYPSLAFDQNGDLGLVCGWGGYPHFAGTAAATYYGGSNAFYPNAIENSTTDDGYSRWGDYVDIQPDAYFPNAFAVAGYATIKNSKNQVQYDPTYTQMIP